MSELRQSKVVRCLPSTADAPGTARGVAALMLTELGHGAHRAEDIALAVSELVTNAVLYGPAGAVELRLLGNQELIRVEVGDQGTAPFHWPVKSDGRLHGLDLVKVFSERCGILHRPSTLAWCEFDLA